MGYIPLAAVAILQWLEDERQRVALCLDVAEGLALPDYSEDLCNS